MPTPAGSITRQKLIDAATRAFAEHGVENASLLEIARQAGQRNRGAVHYHFGSREGLLVAVLAQYADLLREQHSASLAALPADEDLGTLLAALIRPAVDLADDGWRGRCFLVVVNALADHDPSTLDPRALAVLEELGGRPAYERIGSRLPAPLPAPLLAERLALYTSFVLGSIAGRARALERGQGAREPLTTVSFTDNLVAMAVGMLAAPAA